MRPAYKYPISIETKNKLNFMYRNYKLFKKMLHKINITSTVSSSDSVTKSSSKTSLTLEPVAGWMIQVQVWEGG